LKTLVNIRRGPLVISKYWIYVILLFCFSLQAQDKEGIETRDIIHFWEAYDALAFAKTHTDSVAIIQEHYIDRATPGFEEFLKARDFTAEEYVTKIRRYPKFWISVRPLTEKIVNRKEAINTLLNTLSDGIPEFKRPEICFAISAMRTGGTTSKGMILIGSEIAAAAASVDTSELGKWLKSVLGQTGDIMAMIAHETMHIQQSPNRKSNLLTASIREGVADFVSVLLVQMQINTVVHEYGNTRECQLWKDFKADMEYDPKDFSQWLYNGGNSKDRPADLGYYIGYKIAEAYYHKQEDKKQAIKDLFNSRKYTKIYKESEYANKVCKE